MDLWFPVPPWQQEGNPSMQIFIHTPNGLALAEDIDDTATIADLMDKAGLSDSTAWLQDAEDPLELTDLVATVAGDLCGHRDYADSRGGRCVTACAGALAA